MTFDLKLLGARVALLLLLLPPPVASAQEEHPDASVTPTCDGFQGARWGIGPGAFRKAVKSGAVRGKGIQDVSSEGTSSTMLGFETELHGEIAAGIASFGKGAVGLYSVNLHWTQLGNSGAFVSQVKATLMEKYGTPREVRTVLHGLFEGEVAVEFVWDLGATQITLLRGQMRDASLRYKSLPLEAKVKQGEL